MNAGHRVAVVGLDEAGVHVGPRRFVLDELTPLVPAETVVGCDDLALPQTEMTDPEADIRAFGLEPRDARSLAASVAIDLRAVPDGPVAATLAPDEHPRRVRVLDERPGTVRIALHHWTDTLVVGWVDGASVVPLDESEGGSALLGMLATEPRDLTVCRPIETAELFVRAVATVDEMGNVLPHAPGPIEHLGTIAAGTALVRLEDREGGLVRVEPHPGASLHVPRQVEWLVHASALTACAAERYQPPSLSDLFSGALD